MLKTYIQERKKRPLQQYLEETHGYDLAQAFLSLDQEERDFLYSVISNEQLAEIVSYLAPEDAVDVLSDFDINRQKDVIWEMEPDDAVDLIQEFETAEQEELLESLSDLEEVKTLIEYEDDETGSAMTTRVITLTPDIDIKTATKLVIKEAPDVETINSLFVVDEGNHYLGVIRLKDLLRAKPPLGIADLIEEGPFVYDTDSIMKTVQAINNYDAYEMPVCNENHLLLGMITLDDALDRYEEEAQEDFERLAALPETIQAHPFKMAMHRLPWLVLLLFVSIPVSLITSLFQEVITTIAVIVIFQPLISGSAGNVATQTLAVTLRMYQTGEKGITKSLLKEVLTGFFNAVAIGSLSFGITYFFSSVTGQFEPVTMAMIVSISLATAVLFAPVIAILIPTLLQLFKQDPAVASGPLMTTLIDITTVFVYFGLSTLMLL